MKKLHFTDTKQASEYKDSMRSQGIETRDGKDKDGYYVEQVGDSPQSRAPQNVQNLAKELDDKVDQAIENRLSGRRSPGNRLTHSLSRGLGDVAKSLSTNENKRRMRIAQMPGRKAPIARISNGANPMSGKNAGMKRHKGGISYAPKDDD